MKINYVGYDCNIEVSKYQFGGTALQLVDAEDGIPVATVTVNVPNLEKDEVAVKSYSENEGMLEIMMGEGIVTPPHRRVQSGWVSIPVCRLTDKFKEEIK